jgi:hypothetical protein
VAQQAKYPQIIKLASEGYVQGEVEFQKGSAPSFCLGRPKPVQSKNEFFETKSSGSRGLRANLFDGPAKG